MDDQHSFDKIDGLLFLFALQTQTLSQKKNEVDQQVQDWRADIAELRSHVDSIQRNIQQLEEENRMRQSSVIHIKACAKSMRSTNGLICEYEQMLKAELESRKASYNNDTEVFKERIASYREIFQAHKEYYYQHPLAQKLLELQAEKEEVMCRIEACNKQITMKRTILHHFTGPAVNSTSTEKQSDNVSSQLPIKEPEKQSDPQREEMDSAVDISSLHLNQTKMLRNGHKVFMEANAGDNHKEHKVQDSTGCSPCSEETSNEQWSYEQLDEQSWTAEIHMDKQEKVTERHDQVSEQQSTAIYRAGWDKIKETVGTDEDQTPNKEDNEGFTAFPQSSKAPSTPTFPFHFSPTSPTHQRSSDASSPAFLFSENSGPSTPCFSGFAFDTNEDTPFAFTDSFFNKKKTESKSSTCPDFPFDQSDQSEEFVFAFNFKSPQPDNKDNTRDDFPFSFNF